MRLLTKTLLATAALAVMPMAANAESDYVSGTGSASADLDFQIIIPRILFLRVGTGTGFADNGTIDLISFNVPGASLGNGPYVPATAAPGDLGHAALPARLLGNAANVTRTPPNPRTQRT